MTHVRKTILLRIAAAAVLATASVGFAQNAPQSPAKTASVQDGVTFRDIAEVKVNGKSAGLTWAPPYRVDVTAALKPGTNRLEIAVTNQWTNRLMGDRLVLAEKRVLTPAGAPTAQSGFFPGPQTPPESGLQSDVTILVTRNSPRP
jgi:hypothetical protein